MPKVALSLEAAKAKDDDILARLSKVQHAAQSHKQQTKINQQRSEWTDQASKLASEVRRLESDLWEMTGDLGLSDATEDRQPVQGSVDDAWTQVTGVRRLLSQVRKRDASRLRCAPDQALSLQDVLTSVTAAMSSLGASLEAEAAELEQACAVNRRALRQELSADGAWPGEHHWVDRCDLSDEEDTLLERLGGESAETYRAEVQHLNDEVSTEVAQLEQELTDLRRKCKDWDEHAHFRFLCMKQQFHGRRDLLLDCLGLAFPHLSREQLQAHEAHCDALRYTAQRQAAAFRQWRRQRLALLRRHQGRLGEQLAVAEAAAARHSAQLEQRERKRQLHSRLESERARASAARGERKRAESERQRRLLAAEVDKQEAQHRRAQAVKALSREHAERRSEQQLQKEQDRMAQERREAEERAARLRCNAEAIRLRRQMDELKQHEFMRQRSAAEQERREREQRLQQALEKLKVEAPRDPSRLLRQPSRLKVEAYSDPLVCVTRGPHAGFDEGRLMSDARYKLSAALQAAGLFATPAGHEVLAGVPAPRPMQPHFVSQVFAGGYPG